MNPDEGAVTGVPQTRFRLRLLGFPALTASDGSHVTGLGPGKPLAMLAYLAVRGEARRDELVDLLWGEVSEANARNAFRQALHRLRTALGEEILPMDRDRVEINTVGGLDTDRDSFMQAIERGEVGQAIEVYRGDFLEGFTLGEPVFDGWVDAERTRLKGRFQLALQNGAEAALAAGRWLEALQYVQRLTAVAPYDEAAALLEANALVAAGRGSEALQSLRRHAQNLRDQLDLQPSPKVRDMIARIERVDVSRDPTPAARAKETPFVGREHEIATLMGFARGMAAERGATVLIEGEAGLGKSRLVAEFLGRTRSLGPLLVLRGRERPTSAALPYASIAEALRTALRAPGVAGTGRHLLSEASRILPELRDSFDLPEAPPIDAEGGRLRFFEGIAALLDSAAYEQPVCLVLDDLQHASASTVDLLGYLAARLQTSPVLIVLISREVDGDSPVWRIVERDASDESASRVIRLGPLDREAVRSLVEHIVSGAAGAGSVDTDRVTDAAAGNPLRAIELGRRALNGEMPSSTPASLRDILWSRLQKASPSQRRVFFAAALLQRRSSLRLLATASHLPELATFEAAQDLEQLGLLAQEGDSYVVAHDFTTSFVAETSGLAGRALLAGWAADALAAEPGQSSDELATLYALAGQQAAAFTHARRAVYAAASLGSAPEVHRLIGFALAIAPDQKSRGEAEAMMAAFGSGKRLLEASYTEGGNLGRAASPPEPPAGEPAPAATATSDRAPLAPRARLITPRFASLIIVGIVVTALAIQWRRSVSESNGLRSLRDSLLVVERGNSADNLIVITGPIASASVGRLGIVPRSDVPAWSRSLSLPWIRPMASSNGHVAVERMTSAGTDVYVFTGPDADSIPVAIGGGIDAIMGWSPDGGTLLVRRSKALPDGAFDADLWAFRVNANRLVVSEPIDTSATRSVEEATWSPDGSRIAWVAQTGPTHQRDVFISLADGSDVENVTDNRGEDFHISWSSNGSLLAFTSDRDGNPDLFAVEFERGSRRIWRLTNTPAAEDFASFSPDHRFVAFQSTAGGDAAVYVMASLGGTPTRVTPQGGQFSIGGWRGAPPVSFTDRFRIIGPVSAAIGDSIGISLFATDRSGKTQLPDSVTLVVTDVAGARTVPAVASGARTFVVRPQRAGPLTVVASIPGWRADTLTIDVGQESGDLSDDFARGIAPDRWLVLGSPKPYAGRDSVGPALFPNADIEWPSGVLSRSFLSLGDSVDLSVTLRAPFAVRPAAAAQLRVSLVPATLAIADSIAPQLPDYVGVIWDGETSRFTYSVGPESKSDPASSLAKRTSHRLRIVVTRTGSVLFFVDAQLRWTSSLRFLGNASERRARLWLGGRATGSSAAISGLVVRTR